MKKITLILPENTVAMTVAYMVFKEHESVEMGQRMISTEEIESDKEIILKEGENNA